MLAIVNNGHGHWRNAAIAEDDMIVPKPGAESPLMPLRSHQNQINNYPPVKFSRSNKYM